MSPLSLSLDDARQLGLVKMLDKIDQRADVSSELAKAIAQSMVKSGGEKYIMTAQQLIKCRTPGVTAAQAAEHIAQTCESYSLMLAGHNLRAYLTNSHSVFRDVVTNEAKLKYIYLPRRTVQHIFSAGQNMFATAYREMIFDLNDTLVETLVAIQKYNENKEESHMERSAAHQEIQNFIQDGLIVPRQKEDGTLVSSKKQASAKAAGLYTDYYKTAIHPTKRPRKAAEDVGVTMTSKPIIHQTTDVCMQGFSFFAAKVKRKMELATQRGVPMTMDQAQRQVADEDRRRGTYVQQDFDGNDYSEDDQVRAMTDDGFAAVGVSSSTLLALPAPQ